MLRCVQQNNRHSTKDVTCLFSKETIFVILVKSIDWEMELRLLMNSKYKISFIIVYIILAVLICILGFGEDIWLDESFSIHMMDHTLGEIIDFTASDVHPPLYYFILKLFVQIAGNNMIVLRIASIIPFLAMILIVGLFTSKEINPKAGILSMVVMCAAPSILIYSTEIRMYSWCQLFVVCSVIISYKLA